jgi:hypothetical protein
MAGPPEPDTVIRMWLRPEPVVVAVAESASSTLGPPSVHDLVYDDLHVLLSHQAAMLVLASAATVQMDRDPVAARLALARIGTAAEASMRDVREMLARLEALTPASVRRPVAPLA